MEEKGLWYLERVRECGSVGQPYVPMAQPSSSLSGRLTFHRGGSFQVIQMELRGTDLREGAISPVRQRCGTWWPDQHT